MAANETPGNYGLTVDRGEPTGNSLGPDDRRAIHTKIKNNPDEPINVAIVDPPSPYTKFFAQGDTTTTPGTEQTLYSAAVPVGTLRKLSRIAVACRTESTYSLRADGDLLASGRTGAASPAHAFEWTPTRDVGAGVTIELKFTARNGPPRNNVEWYLMGLDQPV